VSQGVSVRYVCHPEKEGSPPRLIERVAQWWCDRYETLPTCLIGCLRGAHAHRTNRIWVSSTDDKFRPPDTIVISKELVARSQLATAIFLWFNYGDPVSIHTLAAATQGVLEGLVGNKHKLPYMRQWKKKFPQRIQRILRDPQNYFKHAWTDQNVITRYQPFIGDMILADACLLHQNLFGLTPGIRAFTIRLSFERPAICAPHELSEKITQGIFIGDLEGLIRPAFLEVVLSRLPA